MVVESEGAWDSAGDGTTPSLGPRAAAWARPEARSAARGAKPRSRRPRGPRSLHHRRFGELCLHAWVAWGNDRPCPRPPRGLAVLPGDLVRACVERCAHRIVHADDVEMPIIRVRGTAADREAAAGRARERAAARRPHPAPGPDKAAPVPAHRVVAPGRRQPRPCSRSPHRPCPRCVRSPLACRCALIRPRGTALADRRPRMGQCDRSCPHRNDASRSRQPDARGLVPGRQERQDRLGHIISNHDPRGLTLRAFVARSHDDLGRRGQHLVPTHLIARRASGPRAQPTRKAWSSRGDRTPRQPRDRATPRPPGVRRGAWPRRRARPRSPDPSSKRDCHSRPRSARAAAGYPTHARATRRSLPAPARHHRSRPGGSTPQGAQQRRGEATEAPPIAESAEPAMAAVTTRLRPNPIAAMT